MSFAGPKDPILMQAMKRLTDQGIILIAAAGNAGPKSPPLFPAADQQNVIAVSATDVDDKVYKARTAAKHIGDRGAPASTSSCRRRKAAIS